jgi:WD40 repeat protein
MGLGKPGSQTGNSVKVWNVSTGNFVEEAAIPSDGPINAVKAVNDAGYIVWSKTATLPEVFPQDLTVGVVEVYVEGNIIKLNESETAPFTHSKPVRAFTSTQVGNDLVIITGGGEGTICLWKLDTASGTVSHFGERLVGHISDVTALLLVQGIACLP